MRFFRLVPMAALAAFLSACAAPEPQPVTVEHDSELRATVQTVDELTREILLRADDGRLLSVVAGPEVRNFDQIEPGDTVVALYVESITASMAAPGQVVETRSGAATDRAPLGARPAGAAGVAIEAVVEWVGYDSATYVSTFIGASGLTHSVVTPPEMRSLAAGLAAGSNVMIEYTAALAVDVQQVGS
jgi:hypothetical protein